MSDLRSAFRTLKKAPVLSLVIILSLAAGIGANTTIFSWLNSAVFHPLPGVTTDLLALEARNAAGIYPGTSWLEYRDLVERLPSFSGIAAQRPRTFYLGDNERGERLWGEFVSGNFFEVLGVRPAHGRFFRPDEATNPGSAPVAVISDNFWRRHFAGSAEAIGQTIKLNNRPLTVIGIAPPGFAGAFNALGFDVWIPLTMSSELMPASRELTDRDTRAYILLGTLRPGVSRARAEGEIAAAARSLAAEHPATNEGIRYELLPLWRTPRGGAILSGALATLQLFAVLILVIVCVNTANLLLARASVRRREMGIRLAIGAGAGRIIRQLLTESVLLALLGSGLGLLLALWGVDAIRHIPVPTNMPVRLGAELDWRGLLFAVGTGAASGLLFGLAPALQLARSDVQHALRGGRGTLSGRSRLRDFLVGTEVAVALVILVLAGLFLKSFRNAQTVDAGYSADRVLLGSVDLVGRGYSRATMHTVLRDAQTRLEQIPGVERAAAANTLPLDVRGAPKSALTIDGAPRTPGDTAQVLFYTVTPGYFATMGIPLVNGTDLAPLDQEKRMPDAIISEEMARRFWPGVSPLGHHFRLAEQDEDYEVVGVARESKYENLAERPQAAVWLTARTGAMFTPVLHVRARSGDPLALLTPMRAALRTLDPELALYDGRTLAQHIDNNLFLQRVPAQMLSLLAPLALLLAAIGLYAVLAYTVAQRTQEIGVRLTLGATPASVVGLIVREGMQVVLLGAAAGWLVALALGYTFSTRFVGVPLGDPVIYGGVPLLLLAVAALACWLPARRAARVDPMIALRAE